MGAVNDILTGARYKIVDTLGKNYKDAELLSYANEGNRLLRKSVALINPDLILTKETKNTVAGTDTVTTSGTILLAPDGYVYVDKKRLSMAKASDFDDLTVRGCPQYFWQEGFNGIRLLPVPDQTYSCDIRYVAQGAALVAGGNTPWPVEYDDLIQEYIVVRAGTRDEAAMDVEQQFLRWFTDQLSTMIILSTPAGAAKSMW